MAELSGVRLPRFETHTNARLKLYPFFYVHQVSNSDIFSRGEFETSDGKPFRPYVVPSKGIAKVQSVPIMNPAAARFLLFVILLCATSLSICLLGRWTVL